MIKKQAEKKMLSSNSYGAMVTFDFFNERLKVDDYFGDCNRLALDLLKSAKEEKLNKIIVKTKQKHLPIWKKHFFHIEGVISNYFHGVDAYFVCHYLDENRMTSTSQFQQEQLLKEINEKSIMDASPLLDPSFHLREANEDDINSLVSLYQTVFKVYPTPLSNKQYLLESMRNGTFYYIVEKDNQIVSAASAEVNEQYHNAEITDCATLAHYRKHRLMRYILINIEKELMDKNIFCSYSIARASSFGMNAVLKQLGYQFGGVLYNNCFIYEDIENMSIWYKDLSSL
ncbi:putative beta-lysine N-acetyltransferase [Bacillus carboniphilus]|uniref:Beta-lysine N-acetyltransferase n=1 Tax=Bacillus carboniphilus TaxID=86663 RepID=A0ABY9JYA3_9BACI|nr:putative beta-lysine N-acetyltransferase [Bacillus carboniphilus]WLR43323.1 putative beta-lysine N-acetyltransferase [Bacillus carboniphilus]